MGIQAQTTQTKLNQIELVKQWLGRCHGTMLAKTRLYSMGGLDPMEKQL